MKLAVLTYPQCHLIASGVLLSFVLIRQLDGVLQTFLPAVLIALFLNGLGQDILATLLLLLAQQPSGNVLVSRIRGSSVGVRPLRVLVANLRGTSLFEVWREVLVTE